MGHSYGCALLANKQFWRFCLVGGGCAALNLMLLHVMVNQWKIHYLLACVLAFFALNLVSYFLNKTFTFGLSRDVNGGELILYFMIMALSLIANIGLMWVLVNLGLTVILASLVLSVLFAVFNYIAHKSITFEKTEQGHDSLLMVSAFFPAHGGGIEVVAGNLAKGFAADGVNVTWIAGGPIQEVPDWSQKGLRIERAQSIDFLERWTGLPMPIWSAYTLRRLWGLVGQVNVVHVHDYLYVSSLVAILFALARRRRVVVTQHIGSIEFKSVFARNLLKVLNRTVGFFVLSVVDQVVYVGRPVKEYFDRFVLYRADPVIIPNGVDRQLYQYSDHQNRTDHVVRILFVGRFVEKKGIDLLRTAVSLPSTSWTFIGWGPKSPLAWPDIQQYSVKVFSQLRADEVVPFYQSADILVLPSTGEGFPLVLQEALACGTPVFVSQEVAEAFPIIDPACVRSVELRPDGGVERVRSALAACIEDQAWLAASRHRAAALAAQWSWTRCVEGYRAICFPHAQSAENRSGNGLAG